MIFARAVVTWFCGLSLFYGMAQAADINAWAPEQLAVLKSLWIGSLPSLPDDPSNKYAADPRAAALGKEFFVDSRFSGNLKVSCATCHAANMNFADDLPLAHGMGTTSRRSMPLIGMAYNAWYFWDGRKDSLWSQALGPFESAAEHGFTRTLCATVIAKHYRKRYEAVFGPLPDFLNRSLPAHAKPSPDDPSALKAWVQMPFAQRDAVNRVYANMGKSIAAFVRTILPTPSRFDRYVEAVLKGDPASMHRILSDDEVQGLRLFIGKANCTNCHSGPLFTNGDFRNVGVRQPAGLPHDRGRAAGVAKVLADEFNCLGKYSDADPSECRELRFIDTDTERYEGAFKAPTLRNVAERAPYMHAGQFGSLGDVLRFYRDLESGQRPKDLQHADLSDRELKQLEAFLRTLSAPLRFAGDDAVSSP